MRPLIVKNILVSLSSLVGLALLTGCETTTSSPLNQTTYDSVSVTERYPELQYREAMKELRLGMTKAEVTTLISEPTRTTPAAEDPAGLERWIYELQHRPQFRTVTAEMEEVPVVDPITGEAGVVMEARSETERFQLIERFTLGFDANDELADLDYSSQRQRN